MNPLPQDQLDARVNAGNSVTNNSQQPTDNSNPPWLQSMLNAGLNSSQSATVLGHATGLQTKNLNPGNVYQNTMNNPQNSGQNLLDMGIGAVKSVGDTAIGAARLGEDVANQTAGRVVNAVQGKGFNPLSNDQLGNDITNPQSQVSKNIDSTLVAKNDAQGLGKALGNTAQALIPVGDVAKGGIAAESIVGKGLQAVKSGMSQVLDSTGITKFLADRATTKATQAVQSTAETMTKGEREAAIAEGRLKSGIMSNSYAPSKTETRAGELLSGNMSSNAAKNVPVVQAEISTRGKEVEDFLKANAKPITNEEDLNAFQKQREKSATYLTPNAVKAYDDQMNVFQGVLKKYAEKDGGYNTSNYYQALKEFETNVTQNLPKGKEALLDEGGSARLQAAKDVRGVVRDMIGQKNPEFKGKMFDLASLYDAKDNIISKAERTDTFSKKFPITSLALKYGAEAVGAGAVYEGVKKTGVPLP